MIRAVAVLALVGLAGGAEAESKPRVGFVNLAEDVAAGRSALDELRARLARRDFVLHPRVDALEGPRDEPPGVEPSVLGDARKAFRQVNIPATLSALDAAEAELKVSRPSPALFETLAEAAMLRGQALTAAHRKRDAVAAFALAHRLRGGGADLDPRRYPPPVRALYRKAAQTRGEPTSIVIATYPADATLWVDGALLGTAPADARVRAGRHWVSAHRPGYAPVTLIHDGSPTLTVRLPELEGDARLASLRAALFVEPSGPALADLCRVLEVDYLAVVAGPRDRTDLAGYGCAGGALGTWDEIATRGPGTQNRSGALDFSGVGERDQGAAGASPSWYKTWWGIGALGLGAVALGAGAFYLLSPDDEYVLGAVTWE